MSVGGQTFNNRTGHGVAASTWFLAGQYTLLANAEVTYDTVVAALFAAQGEVAWAPFEFRVIADVIGVEVRSKTAVSGILLDHYPGAAQAHGPGLTLYPAQNSKAPNSRILFKNVTAGNIILYCMLLG